MRVLLHDLLSGDPLRELETVDYSWKTGVCTADEVRVSVPGYTESSSGLYGLVVPRATAISVVRDDGVCEAAGIVSTPESGEDDDGVPQLEIPSRGIESYFERRRILPYPYGSLIDAQGYPVSQFDTRLAGVDYGTMIRGLYLQAVEHPGADLPVHFEAPRTGTRVKEWAAIDGKGVQDAVEDVSKLENGVEWDWVPTVDENDRLSWTLRTALEATGEIVSAFWHAWTNGGSEPDIRKLTDKVSPEFLASSVFFTGGKDDDRVLVSHQFDSTLLDAGFPLLEEWDSSHSSVSVQATLDGWAKARLADGSAPIHFWSFDVRADRAPGLRKGDWCTVEVSDHWWIPDGLYDRRIVAVGGSADEAWLSVTVAGMEEW